MMLSQRKHEILCYAIEDYIKDACPITSLGVQKKQTIKLSTATLRNELNALEEMGFLKQLHTSGGRVPTTEGYKYYVNYLMSTVKVDDNDLVKVKDVLENRTRSVSEIVSEIAKIISKATNYPTAILYNGYDKLIIDGITVVPLVEGEALALIQTGNGYISNNIHAKSDKKACEEASAFLTKLFQGKTIGFLLENIDTIETSIKNQLTGFNQIVGSVIENLKQMINSHYLDISHENAKDLIEKSSAKDMQKILALLSDKDKLSDALEIQSGNSELFIQIDDEDESMAGLALVKAPIIVHGSPIASIGILGPQRMDYATITAALKVVIEEIKGENDG